MGSKGSKPSVDERSHPDLELPAFGYDDNDGSRHSGADLEILRRYPDFYDPEEADKGTPRIVGFRVRLLDDAAPELENKQYEGLRPLVCVETEEDWPVRVETVFKPVGNGKTNLTLAFEPAKLSKCTQTGKLRKKSETSKRTVCTWAVLTRQEEKDFIRERLKVCPCHRVDRRTMHELWQTYSWHVVEMS